eukprot:PhM_4_TR5975/c3_g1_i2/m.58589/K10395/KIF4_21_27; kinesin family member 4/21/27
MYYQQQQQHRPVRRAVSASPPPAAHHNHNNNNNHYPPRISQTLSPPQPSSSSVCYDDDDDEHSTRRGPTTTPTSERITAVVRIRPVLSHERGGDGGGDNNMNNNTTLCIASATGRTVTTFPPRPHTPAFTHSYNAVYGPKHTTDVLYVTHVQPLVASVLEGYNATVLAYGQTGSGKTFTMSQLIPLALDDVFDSIADDDTVRISYVEVYNETLRDLLHPHKPLSALSAPHPITIRGDNSEGRSIVVAGLGDVVVASKGHAMELLEVGSTSRVVAVTDMNDASSRSHSLFTLHVTCARTCTSSKFHFVDLAGSERNKRTHNTGLRFKESIGINAGLLALQNVLRALAQTQHHHQQQLAHHVPYRESKLTRLLQDSLGGNCRTVFIGCVAPTSSNADETLRTLQYTAQAMNVRNHPAVNLDESNQTLVDVSPRTDRGHEAEQAAAVAATLTAELEVARRDARHWREVAESRGERVDALEAEAAALRTNLRKDEVIFAQKLKEVRRLERSNRDLVATVQKLKQQLDAAGTATVLPPPAASESPERRPTTAPPPPDVNINMTDATIQTEHSSPAATLHQLHHANALLATTLEDCLDVVSPFSKTGPLSLSPERPQQHRHHHCEDCEANRKDTLYYRHRASLLQEQLTLLVEDHDRLKQRLTMTSEASKNNTKHFTSSPTPQHIIAARVALAGLSNLQNRENGKSNKHLNSAPMPSSPPRSAAAAVMGGLARTAVDIARSRPPTPNLQSVS